MNNGGKRLTGGRQLGDLATELHNRYWQARDIIFWLDQAPKASGHDYYIPTTIKGFNPQLTLNF